MTPDLGPSSNLKPFAAVLTGGLPWWVSSFTGLAILRRVIPVSMNLDRCATRFTWFWCPSTVPVVLWYVFPILVILNLASTMSTGFCVPFGSLSLFALLVCRRRVIPCSMYFHATATDVAGFWVPSALFMIIGRTTPILMDVYVSATVATGHSRPLRHTITLLSKPIITELRAPNGFAVDHMDANYGRPRVYYYHYTP